MNKLLNVSSSPHARSSVLTQNLMFDVAIAMIPASVYGVYQFGLKSLCIHMPGRVYETVSWKVWLKKDNAPLT